MVARLGQFVNRKPLVVSPQGIMHGDCDKRDLSNMAMGRLNFIPEQAGQIRAEVTRRTHEAQTVQMASLR
jgi:hypothetical protein